MRRWSSSRSARWTSPRRVLLTAGALAVTVLLFAVAPKVALVVFSHPSKKGVAYFASVKSLYPQDFVRILGVKVGLIDAIIPQGDRVRVEFHYESKYSVPANAGAAIVSPTLVSTRYLQLTPVYTGGPALPDGGVIPLERTTEPIEFDEVKKQLARLAQALGPRGANAHGALSRFLDVAARSSQGQGNRFHTTIEGLSHAIETISNGRGDLFSTVRNLEVFAAALNMSDRQIVEFNQRLGSVSDILADNRVQLGQVITQVDDVSQELDHFVGGNRDRIDRTVDTAGQLVGTVASIRDDLALVLHVAAPAIQNFVNIGSGVTDGPTGVLESSFLQTPASFICNAMAAAAAPNPKVGTRNCVNYLGPLAQLLAVQQSPIGFSPVMRPGGGGRPVPNGAQGFPGPNGPTPRNSQPLPGQSGAPPVGPALGAPPGSSSLPNMLTGEGGH